MREGGWLPTFPTVRAVFDCLISHRLRRRQRAQEIAEVVSERMKLEPHGVGRERPARQPCPLDRALAFLDPLFARPALIVEDDDPLGWARQVRDDETDARIKLAGMPFDFGDHPARLGPASPLIGEIGIEPTHLVRWSSDWALEGSRSYAAGFGWPVAGSHT